MQNGGYGSIGVSSGISVGGGGGSATPSKETEFAREGSRLKSLSEDLLSLLDQLQVKLSGVLRPVQPPNVAANLASLTPESPIGVYLANESSKLMSACDTVNNIISRLEI